MGWGGLLGKELVGLEFNFPKGGEELRKGFWELFEPTNFLMNP